MTQPAARTKTEHAAPPAPRFATAWAAFTYAISTLLLMYPALGGAFLVSAHSDQFGGAVYREFAASSLRAGEGFPLWNPLILGGLPYVAAQHGDIFYPAFLLRMMLGYDMGMNAAFGLHIFLAGLLTYGFLRAWGFSFYPSLAAGAAYMLSGQIASLVSPGHDGKLYVSALAPLLLWMILLGVRDGRLWAWGVVAITTALAILSPHYQMTYYLGVLAGAWTLFLLFRREEPLLPPVRWTRLGLAAAAAGVGVLIAAIQFFPFFEYIPFSPREGSRDYEWATSYAMPPEEAVGFYIPQFAGWLDQYWGRNPLKLHSEYLGASVLVLVGLAFGMRKHRGFVWFWSGAAIWAMLVALGGHTPFYRLWYMLPMMNVVRAPSMILFIVSLAVAVFAAVGLERVLATGVSRRYLMGWGIAALVIALLGTAGGLAGIASTFSPMERYDALMAHASTMMIGAWRSLLFVGLTLLSLWLIAERRVNIAVPAVALVALVTLDLWAAVRPFFNWSPPARELYASDAAIDYLRALDEPGRTFAFHWGQIRAQDPFLAGDALMLHRVRTVTGHQGNEIQRWVELAGAKSPAPPQNVFNPQFRRLANVRYFLAPMELPPQIEEGGLQLERRVGPVVNSVGNQVWLYEIVGEENPAAWVTPARVSVPSEAILPTVLDPRFDPARVAVFETGSPVPTTEISELAEPLAIRASVQYTGTERISISLDHPAPEGSALVVSENFYPGWRASVGGVEVPIGRAQHTLIGVALPAGATQVELQFTERSYQIGRTLTLFGLVLALLAVAGGAVVERRRRV